MSFDEHTGTWWRTIRLGDNKIVLDVKLDVNHSERWNISADQSKGVKLVAKQLSSSRLLHRLSQNAIKFAFAISLVLL